MNCEVSEMDAGALEETGMFVLFTGSGGLRPPAEKKPNSRISAGDLLPNSRISTGDLLPNSRISAGDLLPNSRISAGDLLQKSLTRGRVCV